MESILAFIIVLVAGIIMYSAPSPFRKGDVTDCEIKEHTFFYFFYNNPKDKRLIVPTSKIGIPLTVNLANPKTNILFLLMLALLIVFTFF